MTIAVDIAVIDYGMGNLHSIAKALRHIAPERHIWVGDDPDIINSASHVVYPGVGAIGDCMAEVRARGLDQVIQEVAQSKPLLGICVGMQLLATTGHERVVTSGLNWLPGQVQKLDVDSATHKIPHMGWNMLDVVNGHKVLEGLEGEAVYFVHSFAFCPDDENNCLATTTHGASFAATVGRDNIIGTQFHPEKSQHVGLRLIKNFLEWRP